jgi:hypothetical protein
MPTNANIPLVDVPFFELLNSLPVTTGATSATTTVEEGTDRYIYTIAGSTFYRYDVNADTWQQLASLPVTPAVGIAMKYTRRRGYHGRIISATSNTVRIPGIKSNRLNGQRLQILYGTGRGQERTITYTGETTHDAGVLTAVSSNVITDSTKKWRINEWAGYIMALTFGVGSTTYKKILYNSSTELFVSDVNLIPHDPWNNQPLVTAAPYTLPVTTAGSQAHYEILSHDFTLSSPWDVTPDISSFFTTLSGGIYLITGTAATPFFVLYYYDILNDIWQQKTTYQNFLSAAVSDFALERTGKIGQIFLSNTANSVITATARTLRDTSLNLTPDRFSNHRLLITSGTGRGQDRRIVAHTNNTFTFARSFSTTPDSTSGFEIWPDYDRIYFAPGGISSMFAYSADNDVWMHGQSFDDGVTSTITATQGEWAPIGVTSGARIAAGVTAVNAVPTAAGTGYLIGDVLTCSVGGTGAQVRVTSINQLGAVTGIALVHSGTATGFTVGTGRATSGGTGTGCTIEITTVGATALITTATAHWFVTGNSITFAGCNEGAWNTAHTILGVSSTTAFSVAVTATANMIGQTPQSTTGVVDASKSWQPNEHIGRLVHISTAGFQPTSQVRWITGNSPTQLNVATITASSNGTNKYVIYDSKAFGADSFRKETNQFGYGYANTGTTTTLVDNTKSWVPNTFANSWMRIIAGTGYANGLFFIANNTSNTLNFSTVQTFTPDSTTRYEIFETWGNTAVGSTTTIPAATSRNWPVNYWAGKRVKLVAGTGNGIEIAVTSSTSNVLTTGTSTAPDATSVFNILGPGTRGAGTALLWNWGQVGDDRGRHMLCPRAGGTNNFDIYDISTTRWEYGNHFQPQSELFTTGSSYSYDGANTIFMSRSATGTPVRVFKFNLPNNSISGAMTTTWLQGTATIGNFMEFVETSDGNVGYIYVLQNTGTLLSRAMVLE